MLTYTSASTNSQSFSINITSCFTHECRKMIDHNSCSSFATKFTSKSEHTTTHSKRKCSAAIHQVCGCAAAPTTYFPIRLLLRTLLTKPLRGVRVSTTCHSARSRILPNYQHTPLMAIILAVVLISGCEMMQCDASAIAATPQSADGDAMRVRRQGAVDLPESFHLEHQVTGLEAANALRAYIGNETRGAYSFPYSCKMVNCTNAVMRYCNGPQLINDHCLCEMGHSEDGLSYKAHDCYVLNERREPSTGSCFKYEDINNCCCLPEAARQWRRENACATFSPPASIITSAIFLMILLSPCAEVIFEATNT